MLCIITIKKNIQNIEHEIYSSLMSSTITLNLKFYYKNKQIYQLKIPISKKKNQQFSRSFSVSLYLFDANIICVYNMCV